MTKMWDVKSVYDVPNMQDNAGRTPRTEGVRGGSCSRDFGSHPPRVLAQRKPKVCHLSASVVPLVDAKVISVPTENKSFVRGLSK